ncbi:hypothetical protein PUN28_010925 [Cardiocondyla obscurior]|uniref:Secreted protein n=1 Tax=Cardiocondyla obscurior TaxID=286306 RepID=A0AAW2FP59_9HYME
MHYFALLLNSLSLLPFRDMHAILIKIRQRYRNSALLSFIAIIRSLKLNISLRFSPSFFFMTILIPIGQSYKIQYRYSRTHCVRKQLTRTRRLTNCFPFANQLENL